MRILLVMLIGLVLAACGQNYEEVYGIKIGAPISSTQDHESYSENVDGKFEVEGKPARSFLKENKDGFFENIEIMTVDDIVNTVYLSSFKGKASSEDIDLLLGNLGERWGVITEYDGGAVILSPKSEFIGYIEVHRHDEDKQVGVLYSKIKPSFTIYDLYAEEPVPDLEKDVFKSL